MGFFINNVKHLNLLIMASTSETGHSKNIATFESLIDYCKGYGTSYNPAKAVLKLPALTTLMVTSATASKAFDTAEANLKNVTNLREITFKPLKKLATRVVNALSSSDAIRQTVDDAKTINARIQGKKAKPGKKAPKDSEASEAKPEKTASTSQQSFDKMIEHFTKLSETLTVETKYTPNEPELKVASINAVIADLKAKNTAVINATTAFSNALIARDKLLYTEKTGLVDVALDVKNYVKSVFTTSSPQYRQVSKLQFTRPKREKKG
jgi:hypothetical protein